MKAKKRMLLPLAAVLATGGWYLFSRHAPTPGTLIASGTVEATESLLGFQSAGRIEAVNVREGDAVRAGAELARLERHEMEARQQQARAQVDAAGAAMRELEHGFLGEEIAQAEAAHAAASERRQDAERDLERTRQLRQGGAVSQEALDKSVLALDQASNQEEQAEQQLQLLRRGPRQERIDAQRAQLAHAEASLRVVEAQLDNMLLRSPSDGVISVRHHEPGEIVAAGSAVLTLMNRDDRWVRIYVPEHRIGSVALGQAATIRCDTYPERDYAGTVSFIAGEAEFTPKSVQTAEERVKLVFAVKVRITGDSGQDLKPGMPVDVQLVVTP
jgi:HlyD family secretion protein